MKSNSNLTFINCDASYEEAKVVIFGAPFDGTTSYRPGTRFAPNEIRLASFGLETYSPYLKKDLEDYKINDYGDLDLCFGNAFKVLEQIKEFTTEVINDQKVPFMIGGEHLVTLGSVSALHEKYNDLCLIQFDAHADLREEYLGESLSHACVIKRCFDLLGQNRIFQYGIRSMTKDEDIFQENNVFQNKFNLNNIKEAIKSIGNKPVYITIDLDVLDPSLFSGTGTPEAGGVSFEELRNAFSSLKGMNIVGCDVNELSPHYDQSGVSTITASKVIRELLLTII